jgi:hypothetical protein
MVFTSKMIDLMLDKSTELSTTFLYLLRIQAHNLHLLNYLKAMMMIALFITKKGIQGLHNRCCVLGQEHDEHVG